MLNKIKSFFKPKPKPIYNPYIKCDLCSYVRTDEDVRESYDLNGYNWNKSWLSDNGIMKCPSCLEKERQIKPHCKTCNCVGKIQTQK